MPLTRDYNDAFGVVEHTDKVKDIPNVSYMITGMNLFKNNFTNQTAITFDKDVSTVTLLPSVNRNGGNPTRGSDRSSSIFSLPLGYFHHMDKVTKADYEGKRQSGTASDQDTAANVIAEKLTDMKTNVDQTHEYMKLQALKGDCVTPDGVSLANMFTLFGVSQPVVDFDLANIDDVGAKCRELRQTVNRGLLSGGTFAGNLPVIVDSSFFNKLVTHPSVVQAYLNASSNVVFQKAMDEYTRWGITAIFAHQGVLFMTYDHEFPMPDGTTEAAIELDSGYTIPRVAGTPILQAWYGSSRRMDIDGGAVMFMREYRDMQRQMFHELEVETAPLYYCTKPLCLVKVITSS